MDYASGQQNAGFFSKKSGRYTVLILIAIFAFGTFQALSGRHGSVTAQVDGEKLGVAGSYGETIFISLDDITQVQLVDALEFGAAVDGEESGNTKCGLYENDAYGAYELRAYTKGGPYIVVNYGEGNTLVFNLSSERQTRNIYEDLI